jgi:hypothetical protein
MMMMSRHISSSSFFLLFLVVVVVVIYLDEEYKNHVDDLGAKAGSLNLDPRDCVPSSSTMTDDSSTHPKC